MHLGSALTRTTIALAQLVFLVSGLRAGEVRLKAIVHGDPSEGSATVVVWRVDSGQAERLDTRSRYALDLADGLSLPLTDGTWALEIDDSRFWHARQYVTMPAARELSIDLWPRAEVRGRVASDVHELTLRFEPADRSQATPSSEIQPAGEIPCSIIEGSFQCAIPAGVLDLRLRSPQSIGHYFFGKQASQGASLDLGTIRFERGQSIVGRVEFLRGVIGKVGDVAIHAQPDGQFVEERLLTRTVSVEKNGWFHIDGVAPGTYSLIASRGNLRSEAVDVEVRAGDEVNLLRPLILNPPRSVEVVVTPPADPDGHPWSVSLSRLVTASYSETVTASRVSATGGWSAVAVAPGSYDLEIGTAAGATWYRETIDLRKGDAHLAPVLSLREVRGHVTIGDGKPLVATVTFLDSHGLSSDALSDADGVYLLRLPNTESKTWNVHIDSDEPAVHKYLHDVVVGSEDGKLDFSVTESVLTGIVLTEAGEPIDGGWVDVSGDDDGGKLTQASISSSGEFAVYGLEPGSYNLRAVSAEAESAPTTITLDADESYAPVRLTVRAVKQVKGMIRSRSGPIPGARVTLIPGGGPPMSVEGRTSDGGGRYVQRLPPGLASFDLAVAAPGFAFMLDHVDYHDKPLLSLVDQRPGTLILRGPQVDGMLLRHNGARIWVSMLLVPSWTGRADTDGTVIVPSMEPGAWSLCSGERCVDGFLAPFGTLNLDMGS